MFSVEIAIEKERKKVKNVFKTNVLVPNTKNVRRWRHRSGFTYLLFGEIVRAVSTVVCQAGPAAFSIEESKLLGNSHKILQMSYLRRRRNAGYF